MQGAVRRLGKIEPFLVTLPLPQYHNIATATRAEEWSTDPAWKLKALRAAKLAMGSAGVLAISIESEIPTGRGCGSSTADCVATVRAVACILNKSWSAEQIARMVQRAELASDSTMFDMRPVAFFSRVGEILRPLGKKWRAMKVDVVDMGGPDVCTLQCGVPPYSEAELDEFALMLDELAVAIGNGDVNGIGSVALRSAAIQQRYRSHASWEDVRDSALAQGAAGVAIAHSGTVAAVISSEAGEKCQSYS